MAKKNFEFNEEFNVNPEAAEAVPVEGRELITYTLKDGTEGSRAAYIRELFLIDNLSRKEIAEREDIPYRVVYGATVNMTNDAEGGPRTRNTAPTNINVTTEDMRLLSKAEDGTFTDAETGDVYKGTPKVMKRNEWIVAQIEAGADRSGLSKLLGVSYGVIYSATKDMEGAGSRSKHMIETDDGETISRSEYIRRLANEGMEKGEIAKKLDVQYSVVWQALKVKKTDAEKYTALLEQISAYADRLDPASNEAKAFTKAVEQLEAFTEDLFPEPTESEE